MCINHCYLKADNPAARFFFFILSDPIFKAQPVDCSCMFPYIKYRGVNGGWAGWAIAHPVFGRIEGARGRRQQCATLLLAHPVLGSHMNHKNMECSSIKLFNKLWILCLWNYVTKNRNHYQVIDNYVFVILHYGRSFQILSMNCNFNRNLKIFRHPFYQH